MSAQTTDNNDTARARILAFVRTMRPLRGTTNGEDEDYQHGRALIERLADAGEDEDGHPTLRFTSRECALVCWYLRSAEPFEGAPWWTTEPAGQPSHLVGYQLVLGAIVDRLIGGPEMGQNRKTPYGIDRPNGTLKQRLEAQRDRVFEMQAIIELTNDGLCRFSGDEDAEQITEDLSTHSSALNAAHRLASQIAEQLDLIGIAAAQEGERA